MKIAAYQFAVSGDILKNYDEINQAIHTAKKNGAELLVFPECALTGYPPMDIRASSDIDFGLVRTMCGKLQKTADEEHISFIVGMAYEDSGIRNRAILFQPGKSAAFYDKRALWGWDQDNFIPGNQEGVFETNGIRIGVRICYEVRFPECFRELYLEKTDMDIVLFYDVSDTDDKERYVLIKGHLQTRAVENVTTMVSVDAIHPYQTAPTAVFGKSGRILKECKRNQAAFLYYDFEKEEDDFGDRGRREISDRLLNVSK